MVSESRAQSVTVLNFARRILGFVLVRIRSERRPIHISFYILLASSFHLWLLVSVRLNDLRIGFFVRFILELATARRSEAAVHSKPPYSCKGEIVGRLRVAPHVRYASCVVSARCSQSRPVMVSGRDPRWNGGLLTKDTREKVPACKRGDQRRDTRARPHGTKRGDHDACVHVGVGLVGWYARVVVLLLMLRHGGLAPRAKPTLNAQHVSRTIEDTRDTTTTQRGGTYLAPVSCGYGGIVMHTDPVALSSTHEQSSAAPAVISSTTTPPPYRRVGTHTRANHTVTGGRTFRKQSYGYVHGRARRCGPPQA